MASTSAVYDVKEVREFANRVVKYILNNSISKLPIKRADIVVHALNGKQNEFQNAFEAAKIQLLEIYGISVAEVPLISKSIRQFICISNNHSVTTSEYTTKQRGEITLLFIILSYIFMKGGSVKEEVLFQTLQNMNIKIDTSHSFFGSEIKKLITDDFVKQLYLKREKKKLELTNEDDTMYSWGFRSTLEFPKSLVLEAVAKLLQKPSACFIRQHYEVYGHSGDDDDVEMTQN